MVDSEQLVREGLAAIINNEPDMAVIAAASNGVDAVQCFREHRPDVVTLDLLLPDLAGEEVARRILSEFPDARIVVTTSAHGDVQMARAPGRGRPGIRVEGNAEK